MKNIEYFFNITRRLHKHMLLNNLFLCILTIAFVEGGFAQSSLHVQDMERQLESAGSDQRRAELLYKWGDRVGIGDTLQSIRLIRRGLHYASGDALQQGVGYFYLGRVYMDFSAIKAEAVFDTAIHYQCGLALYELWGVCQSNFVFKKICLDI